MTELPRLASTPSTATPEHQAQAPRSVRLAVVTISDTRTPDNDASGQYLKAEAEQAGHTVVDYVIVKDDGVEIRTLLTRLMRESDIILTSGGTGLTGRDVTIPVVESLITKPLPGFGELFRMLSYQEVGGAAMLSRATGGLARTSLIFAMPGSLNAVQTAWRGILIDQLGHLVYEVARQGQPELPHLAAAPVVATVVVPQASNPLGKLQNPEHVNQGVAAGLGRHSHVVGSTPPEMGRHGLGAQSSSAQSEAGAISDPSSRSSKG